MTRHIHSEVRGPVEVHLRTPLAMTRWERFKAWVHGLDWIGYSIFSLAGFLVGWWVFKP